MEMIRREMLRNVLRRYLFLIILFIVANLISYIIFGFTSYNIVITATIVVVILGIYLYWNNRIKNVVGVLKNIDLINAGYSINSVYIFKKFMVGANLDYLDIIDTSNISKISFVEHPFDVIKYSDKMSVYLNVYENERVIRIQLDSIVNAQKLVDYFSDINQDVELLNIGKKGSCGFNELFNLYQTTRY